MKTAISVPDPVFERVDREAKRLGVSRSEFFAKAAERYLDALHDESVTARIDAALSQVVDAEEEAAAWRQVGLAAILAATAEDEW